MSNTPKWMLDPDLKTIREIGTEKFGRADHWNIFDEKEHLEIEEAYLKYQTSLKSHPAEKFTPEYAGKELEEGREFEIMRDVIDGHPFAIPLSNTANPKGEESDE